LDCATLVTPRTRAIVLVTPNNPVRIIAMILNGSFCLSRLLSCQTGATYSPALLSSFAMLAKECGIALIVDETYRDLIPSGPPHKLFGSTPIWDWRSNFIHLFSFSKSYCVPGHRLGAIIASPICLDQINTVLDCMQASIFGTSTVDMFTLSTRFVHLDLFKLRFPHFFRNFAHSFKLLHSRWLNVTTCSGPFFPGDGL
jgi:alanine-alpha-ketoisovalerate/valine-pyruvate aminotransferase